MKDLEIEKIRGVEGDFVRLLNVAKNTHNALTGML